MDHSGNSIEDLIIAYLDGKLDDDSLAVLEKWIQSSDQNRQYFEEMTGIDSRYAALKEIYSVDKRAGWEKFKQRVAQESQPAAIGRRRRKWFGYVVPAIILLMLSGSIFIWFTRQSQTSPARTTSTNRFDNDLLPGKNKAILTLGNGTTIVLDSTKPGILAEDGGAKIAITASDGLVYQRSTIEYARNNFNTLITEKGNQYRVELPDGSKVWLNAASSLRYPTTFTGNERSVVLTGEAYFEITKSNKPFTVTVNDMKVQVLGTQFNIMAYPDEDRVRTTLVEGSVRIEQDAAVALLRPGQQAQLKPDSKTITIAKDVNMGEVVAWKNGLFSFSGKSIEHIMRDVSRWYDVETVSYEGHISKTFSGSIPRTVKASDLFNMLELTGNVQFRIEGRKIVVLPAGQ